MGTDFEVTMNEYLPLRDVVFNTLRQAILRGELKPGERLMEIQLANKLGVSRTPIREAIRKLELEGLVLMIPRKGAEVAEITEKNLRDVLEVRCALEELAVQLACDRMDEDGIKAMKEASAEFCNTLDSDDITRIAQADVAFHDIIYAATDNRRLIQLLNNLREQMYRYRIEYLKKKEELKTYDINMFLLEEERLRERIRDVAGKYELAAAEMDEANVRYEKMKEEYNLIEGQVEEIDLAIETARTQMNETGLLKQQLEGQINVLKEQINQLLPGLCISPTCLFQLFQNILLFFFQFFFLCRPGLNFCMDHSCTMSIMLIVHPSCIDLFF